MRNDYILKSEKGRKAKIKRLFYFIKREINLITHSPFGYLEIILCPPRKVKVEKYNPKTFLVAKKIIEKIKRKFPELKVYYHGSSALKISGQNDIDLLLACKKEDFEKYLPRLTRQFGDYNKISNKSLSWEFLEDGFKVELILIDPKSKSFREIIEVFRKLRSNKDLLKEYEALKCMSKKIPVKEFEREKLYFYNKLINIKN